MISEGAWQCAVQHPCGMAALARRWPLPLRVLLRVVFAAAAARSAAAGTSAEPLQAARGSSAAVSAHARTNDAAPAAPCLSEWTLVNASAFSERSDFTLTPFNGQLLLTGGGNYSVAYNVFADVWATTTGAEWTLVTAAAAWPPRAYHAAAVLSSTGQLAIAGGGRCVGDFNVTRSVCIGFDWYADIWATVDGASWALLQSAPAWPPRGGHTMHTVPVSGADERELLVLTGGLNNNIQYNDTYFSADGGITWQLAVQGPWSGRSFHQGVVFNGSLFITGGGNFQTGFNDVWRLLIQAGGRGPQYQFEWVEVTPAAPWSSRTAHTLVVVPLLSQSLTVVSGAHGSSTGDADSEFGGGDASVASNSTVPALALVAGMHNDTTVALADVWLSLDGYTWSLSTSNASFPKRSFHASAVAMPMPMPMPMPAASSSVARDAATTVLVMGGFRLDYEPEIAYRYYGDVWAATVSPQCRVGGFVLAGAEVRGHTTGGASGSG